MASCAAMNAGEPANEASVDGLSGPCKDHQSDGGDQEFMYSWTKGEMASGNGFFFEDEMSPPIPIDPRYYEDPTVDNDDSEANVLKIFPDMYKTPIYDLCSQMAPITGGLSYCYFSLSNMDPSWFGKAFGGFHGRVSNLLWLQAHVGAGVYIFSRRHIRSLPVNRAVLYSVLGSVLFNFGSCMVWGLGRMVLRSWPTCCRVFGLVTSCLLLYAGQDYLQCIDDRFSEELD